MKINLSSFRGHHLVSSYSKNIHLQTHMHIKHEHDSTHNIQVDMLASHGLLLATNTDDNVSTKQHFL